MVSNVIIILFVSKEPACSILSFVQRKYLYIFYPLTQPPGIFHLVLSVSAVLLFRLAFLGRAPFAKKASFELDV